MKSLLLSLRSKLLVLGVAMGRAGRVWRQFLILTDRVGFEELKSIDHPYRWSDRAGQVIGYHPYTQTSIQIFNKLESKTQINFQIKSLPNQKDKAKNFQNKSEDYSHSWNPVKTKTHRTSDSLWAALSHCLQSMIRSADLRVWLGEEEIDGLELRWCAIECFEVAVWVREKVTAREE